MNKTTKNNPNQLNEVDAGYVYLRSRFVRKNKSYIDTIGTDFQQYQLKDLLGILRQLGYSSDHIWEAERMLKTQDVRTWSGKEVFKPGFGRIVDNDSGTADINNWTAPDLEPVDGDATPFVDFLATLIPVESERHWFLSFVAQRYQKPEVKPQHAAILYGKPGTGKSTIYRILKKVFGASNVHVANTTEALTGSFAIPNWTTQWIIAEELRIANSGAVYNALKNLVTGSESRGQRKGQDWATFQTPASLLILSNDQPTFIEPNDRRYFIVETPYPWTGDHDPAKLAHFKSFNEWLDTSDGYALIAGFLKNFDCEGYDPMAAPPTTEAKQRIFGVVKVGLRQEVEDYLADLDREIVSNQELESRFERIPSDRMRHVMSDIGWRQHPDRVQVAGKKMRFWLAEGATIESRQTLPAVLVTTQGGTTELKSIDFGSQLEAENAL